MIAALPLSVSSLNWILGMRQKLSNLLPNQTARSTISTNATDGAFSCPTFAQPSDPFQQLHLGNVVGCQNRLREGRSGEFTSQLMAADQASSMA